MFMLLLVGLPLAYLLALAVLLLQKDPRGIGVSLLFVAAVALSTIWATEQSRSSTAALGFLALPPLGALGGFFGLAFERWRKSPAPSQKIGAWLALAGLILLMAVNVFGGVTMRRRNNARDARYRSQSAQIARDRETIEAGLKQNPARQGPFLDSSIRANLGNRAFLLAALPHDSISPGLLDTLANSRDPGIALEAVRNPATSAATLRRIYKTPTFPYYFYQALAAQPHTPPDILRELYRRPQPISGLPEWLAGNPSTPKDVLEDIARTSTDDRAIGQLLENPALDCGLLTQIGVRLAKAPQRDPPDPNVMRATERIPDICLAKAKL